MKHILGMALAGVAVLGAAAVDARADAIVIHDTGADDAGDVLAPGTADPHWRIVQTPAGALDAPATVAAAHWVYIQNDPVGTPGSSWISAGADTASTYAAGTYVYRTTFDLTGLDAATAQLSGMLMVDDQVTDVVINGTSLGSVGGGFVFTTAFAVTSGFRDGVNTLDFVVANTSAGPSGFRVVWTSATADAVAASDTTAPVFTSISVTPDVIDRNDHRPVEVVVTATVEDDSDPSPWVRIVSVTSDETSSAAASKRKSRRRSRRAAAATPAEVTSDLTATVIAERNGNGDGRTYTITVAATDEAGNTSTAAVTVFVPHDAR